jgi:hypothetical protein
MFMRVEVAANRDGQHLPGRVPVRGAALDAYEAHCVLLREALIGGLPQQASRLPETWWESPHVLEFAAAARDAAAATAATDALCRERWRQHHEGIGERNYTARSRGWQRHFCSKAPFMPPGVPCDARAGCRDFDGVGADVLTDAGWKTEDVYPGHSKPLLISAGARPGRPSLAQHRADPMGAQAAVPRPAPAHTRAATIIGSALTGRDARGASGKGSPALFVLHTPGGGKAAYSKQRDAARVH